MPQFMASRSGYRRRPTSYGLPYGEQLPSTGWGRFNRAVNRQVKAPPPTPPRVSFFGARTAPRRGTRK